MESSLLVLIPLSILLVFVIGVVLWWSVRSGQFEDMEGPAFRVLMDDDSVKPEERAAEGDATASKDTRDT